ncbi:MAG: urease accessory protein UreD [Pseudomonadota bacterium]
MSALAEKLEVSEPIFSWEARLQLGLVQKNNKTLLNKRRHVGPLTLQRPFYPENDGTCHLYILHPPGGVAGGDSLHLDLICEENTSTLVTTPGASKFYQSNGFIALQKQNLSVKKSACLEWLPQETILFDGSNVNSATNVQLESSSTFIGWEIVSFGRPACLEEFSTGIFNQSFEIWRDGAPLIIDKVTIKDRAEVFSSLWGLQSKPVMGLMTVVNPDTTLLQQAKENIQKRIEGCAHLSVSVMGDVLICRCLDTNSMSIRDQFIELWKMIRPITTNKQPCEPRIWAT